MDSPLPFLPLLFLLLLLATPDPLQGENNAFSLYHGMKKRQKTEQVGFIFNHIPKCGGTSFMNSLCTVSASFSPSFGWYPPACFADIKKKVPYSWNMPGCPSSPSYGSTHCSYTEITDCITNPTTISSFPPLQRPHRLFITMLRDPVDRIVSEYLWWKGLCRNKGRRGRKSVHPTWPEGLCDVVLENKKPLELFVDWLHYPNNPALNRVAKSIGFFPQHLRSPQKSHEECLFFDLKKQEEFVRKVGEEGRKEGERGRGMEEDYERRLNENERVLERILSEIEENFFFIGLTDRFDESLRLFTKMLRKTFKKNRHSSSTASSSSTPSTDPTQIASWGYFGPTVANFTEKQRLSGRHQTTRRQGLISVDSLPPEIKEEIRRKNVLDLEIYEFVLKKFEKALELYGVRGKGRGMRKR